MKLKPCPFCGGKAKIMGRNNAFHGGNAFGDKLLSWVVYIRCNKCFSRGKPIKTTPIRLSDASFYRTSYWLFSETPFTLKNDEVFLPYITAAVEAWNRRTNDE